MNRRNVRLAVTLGIAAALAAFGAYQLRGSTVLALNGTPSVPVGLYLAHKTTEAVAPGDLVCVSSAALPSWARDRHYLPDGMRLCKRVAASSQGWVFRERDRLAVCNTEDPCKESVLRTVDSKGRALTPAFPEGPSDIPAGFIYLHSEHPKGLDSRYLGLLPSNAVVLRLTPLLVSGDER